MVLHQHGGLYPRKMRTRRDPDATPSDDEWPRPAVSEQTLRDVLGGAGWDIESLEPATWRREIDGNQVEMAFWYVRAQRR